MRTAEHYQRRIQPKLGPGETFGRWIWPAPELSAAELAHVIPNLHYTLTIQEAGSEVSRSVHIEISRKYSLRILGARGKPPIVIEFGPDENGPNRIIEQPEEVFNYGIRVKDGKKDDFYLVHFGEQKEPIMYKGKAPIIGPGPEAHRFRPVPPDEVTRVARWAGNFELEFALEVENEVNR